MLDPEEEIIRLSDSFNKLKSLGLTEKDLPSLELIVRVININEGKNRGIVERCKKLSEYSAFIAKVREFEKGLGSFEEAITKAIKYCQKHDILKVFLELHGTEVVSMLMTEWNWDDALAVRFEEGWEGGLEKGREEGQEAVKVTIAKNLLSKGSTPEFVREITGLSLEIINDLSL